jgi:hypothetical protein
MCFLALVLAGTKWQRQREASCARTAKRPEIVLAWRRETLPVRTTYS